MGALTATKGTFNGSATDTDMVVISATGGSTTYGLRINGSSAFAIRDISGTSNLLTLAPTTGNASFTGSVSMGALTATTGAFSGNVQFGSGYTEFADRAAPGTFNSRYLSRSGGNLLWRGNGSVDETIYTTGNVITSMNSLVAITGMKNIPIVCTNANKPAANTVPTNSWVFVIDDATYDQQGSMYQSNGSSWINGQKGYQTIGAVAAGSISAGALSAYVALVQNVISSSVFQSGGSGFTVNGSSVPGNNSGTPVGWAIYSTPQASKYADGTTDTMVAEFGGNVSIGGYKAAVIANRVMGNSPSWTSNSTWTCPEGITKVSLTLQGAGANGAAGVSVGNAGGGGGCGAYLQRSITVTPGTVYYISFDSGTVNFRTGGYSGTILYSAAIGGAASAPTHGNNGSAYYQPTPELLVPIPTTAGIDGQPWTGSGPTINYGGAGGISPFDASGYGSGGKGQDILKAGGVSGVAGTGMPGFARIIY